MMKTFSTRVLACAIGTMALATAAAAQEYPTRPIRIMVGFSPGGSNDLISRMLAAKLTERLGKQVVVENRAGASGAVASEIVANAPPDGHLLMLASVAHTANPSLMKLNYDTEKGVHADLPDRRRLERDRGASERARRTRCRSCLR